MKILKRCGVFFVFFNPDIDECSSDVDDCHNDANCTNTAGSFTCTCREGYTGNGTSCSGMLNWTCSGDALMSNLQ